MRMPKLSVIFDCQGCVNLTYSFNCILRTVIYEVSGSVKRL